MWLQDCVFPVFAVAAFLRVAAVKAEALSKNTDTIVNCTVKDVYSLRDSPSFFNKLESREAMEQISFFIELAAPPNDLQQCKLDIGQFVEQLPEDDVMVLYTKLICADERPFQVILENSRAVEKKNGIGYLWVFACRVFWKHMAVYGRAVDLRVLYLEEWEDQFEEELESFGTPARFPSVYDEDLRNIGTMAFLQQDLKNTASLSTKNASLPNILSEYSWPAMAELAFVNVSYALNAETLRTLASTMPQLQTLEIQHCRLTTTPAFFPWGDTVLNLPRNLSRSPIGNDHYASGIGIDVKPNEYRRLLRLDNNVISDLTNVQFRGRIDVIDLNSNHLTSLGADTFRNATHLQLVNLSKNRLITIPETTFHGLDDLVHLDLSYNLLTNISPETFRHLISLQTISLQNNHLSSIGSGFFSHLLSLQQIDVSSNNLTYIDEDAVLVNSDQLQSVNFAKNQLTEIPKWLFVVRKLRKVDLSDNFVSFDSFLQTVNKLDNGFLMFQNRRTASSYLPEVTTAALKTVNFQRNNFTRISMDQADYSLRYTFSLLLYFFELDVEGNPLVCDCHSYSFYQYMSNAQHQPTQSDIHGWKCNSPTEVKGTAVISLSPTTFRCPRDYPECPDRCTCYERTVDGAVEVDCRGRNLTEMPGTVPSGTQVLDLDNNSIFEVSKNHSYFRNLTNLSLAYNEVAEISDAAFGSLTNLTRLHLHNNRLKYLPEALGKMHIGSITLKSNPYVCDCHSKWLKHWLLRARHVVRDVDDLLCTAGKPQGKQLIEAEDEQYVCAMSNEGKAEDGQYVCAMSNEGKAAIGLAAVVIVMSFAIVMIYILRRRPSFKPTTF